MGAELSAMLDRPFSLFIVLAIGAAIRMGIEKFWSGLEQEALASITAATFAPARK